MVERTSYLQQLAAWKDEPLIKVIMMASKLRTCKPGYWKNKQK